MGKKNDMYINYAHSNKKRGHRSRKKLWITLFVILIICIGLSVYFFLRSANGSYHKMITPKKPITTLVPSTAPSVQPVNTTVPTIQAAHPTAKAVQPTIQPTIAAEAITQSAKTTAGNDLLEEDTQNPDLAKNIKGVYVTANAAGSDKINELIQMVDKTEINAMVIDIKDDHGKISYAMDCDLAKQIDAITDTIPDIGALVKKLKEKNIYLIARIVAFKDPYLAKKRTDLAIKNKDGSLYMDSNGEYWVNPYNKKVWNYLVDIASQSAAAGFDEVQFDYIRFSTSKGISAADFGDEVKNKSKEKIITEFTKYAYGKLKPLGVAVSADVYGTIIASSVDAKLVGQNFVEMSKYLDYICPMIYPSHFGEGNFGIKYPDQEPFKIISKVLAISATKLKDIPEDEHQAVVRPWLQDFTASWIEHHIKYSGEEIREEIDGVYSVGYKEWLLWNAGCNYSEDGLLEK